MKKASFNPQLSKAITIFMILTVFLSACRRDNNNPAPQTINCSDITTDVVWKDRGDGIDYVLNCVISVRAKLTIAPGVVIQCKSGAGILVENSGALLAVGTAEKKIELKGDVDAPGVWKGVFIRSNNVQNELAYCLLSNGGSSSFDGNTTRKANIRVANNAQFKIRNTVVAKSMQDGLFVDGLDADAVCPITLFANNEFIDNQGHPISSVSSIGNVLDGTATTYTGNLNNKVLLRSGRMYGAHTWKKMSVPYLIQGIASVGYSSNSGNLTIEPGVRVEFKGDAGLCTGDYSTDSWLKANGTSAERIVFTGETATPGAWKGLAFQSTSSNNQLSFVDVSFGGSSSYTGATQKRANLHGGAWSAGTFTISNSTVANSAAWGIWVTASSPNITVPVTVTYTNNASGNYFKE